MSTKIFNVWLLPVDTNVQEVATSLLEDVRSARIQLDLNELLEIAVVQMDALSVFGGEPLTEHPLAVASRKYLEEQGEYGSHSALNDPNRFEVRFFHDETTGRDYARFSTFGEHYQPLIESLGWEPYNYYDHTDGPEHISRKEWKARGELWNRLYETAPQTVFSLEQDVDGYDLDELMEIANKGVPSPLSREQRIRRLMMKRFDEVNDMTGQDPFEIFAKVSELVYIFSELDYSSYVGKVQETIYPLLSPLSHPTATVSVGELDMLLAEAEKSRLAGFEQD